MIHLGRLSTLCELADRGTIAATAEALHLTPSAVSQQLAALELEVGEALLKPDGRSVRLTPVASLLVRRAASIFVQVEALHADLLRHRSGATVQLRIGAFASAISGLVAPAAKQLRRTVPEVNLEVAELEAPEALDQLLRHELDVVISMQAPGAPSQDDPRIARVELVVDALEALLPADHGLAGLREIPIEALSREPWILPPPGQLCAIVILAGCQSAGFTPRAVHRCADWGATAALVGSGLGVALTPRLAGLRECRDVAVRQLAHPAPARHLFAAIRRGSGDAPVMRAFLDALTSASPPSEVPDDRRMIAQP